MSYLKSTSFSLALPNFNPAGTLIAVLVGVVDDIASVSSPVSFHLMEQRNVEITKRLEFSKY